MGFCLVLRSPDWEVKRVGTPVPGYHQESSYSPRPPWSLSSRGHLGGPFSHQSLLERVQPRAATADVSTPLKSLGSASLPLNRSVRELV